MLHQCKRQEKVQGSAKPGPGALIQRGVTVSPSVESNEQLSSNHAGVSSTCPEPSIPTLPCLHTIPFLPGSCTRSWTGEYYMVHSTTLRAALQPQHGVWHQEISSATATCQAKDYESNSVTV